MIISDSNFLTKWYKIIVTSYLFPDGKFSLERLKTISSVVGKDKLVVDVRSGSDVLAATGQFRELSDNFLVAVEEETNGLLP